MLKLVEKIIEVICNRDFTKNQTSILYEAWTDSKNSYYDKDHCEPFKPASVTVVSLSHENNKVKIVYGRSENGI